MNDLPPNLATLRAFRSVFRWIGLSIIVTALACNAPAIIKSATQCNCDPCKCVKGDPCCK